MLPLEELECVVMTNNNHAYLVHVLFMSLALRSGSCKISRSYKKTSKVKKKYFYSTGRQRFIQIFTRCLTEGIYKLSNQSIFKYLLTSECQITNSKLTNIDLHCLVVKCRTLTLLGMGVVYPPPPSCGFWKITPKRLSIFS